MKVSMFAVKPIAILSFAFLISPVIAQQAPKPRIVHFTIVDETGAPVPDANLTIRVQGMNEVRLAADDNGRAICFLRAGSPYHIHSEKAGFFQSDQDESDSTKTDVRIVLSHAQMVVQSVDVKATTDGIDPQELADTTSMEVKDLTNIPYPADRDIRQLLQYFPGTVADRGGKIHVAGSDSGSVLDMLDGFDIRSPYDGQLSMRFSADAVHSIAKQSTRYPVEYGRNTGGVIAFRTGMGDDKIRFNVTDFIPQFEEQEGLRFENFVPRVTLSGPIRRNQAWFFDGLETELNIDFVPQLPKGAQNNFTTRGSNLLRTQWNPSPDTIVTTGLLFNDFHSPYSGLTPNTPQESTQTVNTIAWFPYTRLQHRFGGALLDTGFGVVRFNSGSRPHAGDPFALEFGRTSGAYFETDYNQSQSVQSNAVYYFQPRLWLGVHDLKAGLDLDQTRYTQATQRNPVQYLAANGTLMRRSTFPTMPAFTRHNLAAGVFFEDHWTTGNRWLFEPGVRFDWNEVTRQPTLSPRVSLAWIPGRAKDSTKIAAGIGIYYEHTQLDYLARSLYGTRYDTYYADDGMTPLGPPMVTSFAYDQKKLKQPYAINWSLGLEQQLPGHVYLKVNFIHKSILHEFTYLDMSGSTTASGSYVLTNNRTDRVVEVDIQARHTFRGGYTLFGAYTHSSARTNAAIDYTPGLSNWGPQQSGPLPWDTPNRVVSWGWLPLPVMRNRLQFVYSLNWRTGFPFTALNNNQQVIGAADGFRYPNYMAFDPGVEWKLHVHGYHLAMRTVVENATNAADPFFVNPYVDSPNFDHFYNSPGRAFTVRLRLLDTKHHSGLFH
jgi:hypothetical protein